MLEYTMEKLKMYEVVAHHDLDKFVALVNMFTDQGWELVGQIVVTPSALRHINESCFFQTLIKNPVDNF